MEVRFLQVAPKNKAELAKLVEPHQIQNLTQLMTHPGFDSRIPHQTKPS